MVPGFPVSVFKNLLHQVNHRLEGFGVIHGEVGQRFAAEFDIFFMEFSNENRVTHSVLPHTCVDAGDPEASEIAFLVSSVAVCIGHSFFVCIFSYRPNIFSSAELPFNLI